MIDIYRIKNKISGKSYIGQSVDVNKRFNRHISELANNTHHNINMQEEYDKYGPDSFECKILVYDLPTQEDADIIEESLINAYIDDGVIYNINRHAHGGDITSTHPNNEEIRKKISEASKRMYLEHPEIKENLRKQFSGENNPMYGKHHSEETRRKMSENSGIHKKVFTDEERKAISDRINKQYQEHPEILDKISNNLKQKYQDDPSYREKVSAASKANWERPEYREKMIGMIKESAKSRMKPVHGNGTDYECISEACKDTGLTTGAVINRCRSNNFPDWYYI